MPFFEWSEAMSLGEPLLDADHKCLIGLINRLHESFQDGTGSDVLDDIFDGLIAYIEFHFAREEKVIEACDYPGAKAHQEEHAEFTQHIYDLRDRHVRGTGPAITHESLHYLRSWLNHHIMTDASDTTVGMIIDKWYEPRAARSVARNLVFDGR